MKFVGLVSGGKDSIYSICKLIDEGNTLVALVHIISKENYSDSYMYQTVGSEIASLLGRCFNTPLYTFYSRCKTICTDLAYSSEPEDEVEDLYKGLKSIVELHPFDGVCSGAILSTYQKNRVENICARLGLKSIAPLWNRCQKELLEEMIEYGIDARIIKVASSMLNKNCLNMDFKQIYEYMKSKKAKYEVNYCGEGGEFETIVLDCPHFKNKIVAGGIEVIGHPDDNGRDDGVFYLVMKDTSIIPK